MKVVILDDEEKVLTLVRTLIDWSSLKLELMGTSSDGISGLALVKKIKPDLLITDIRMPGITGLQLIEEAKKILPDLQVILISGYSQFDYAQTAIRCGVTDYLLKPVKKQELDETLNKMVLEYEQKRRTVSHAQQIEEKIKTIETERKQEALLSIIRGESVESAEQIGLPFPVEIISLKIDGKSLPYDIKAAEVLLKRICRKVGEVTVTPFVCVTYGLFVFVAISGIYSIKEYAEKLIIWCKDQIALFTNFTITISIGTDVTCLNEYPISIEKTFMRISERLRKGTACIYDDGNEEVVTFDVTTIIKTIVSAMVTNDRHKIEEVVSDTSVNIKERNCSCFQIQKLITEGENEILEEMRLILEDEAYSQVESNVSLLEMADSLEQLQINISLFLYRTFDIVVASCRERHTRPIREAQHYIKEHFNDNQLNLNEVAKQIGLNSNYFSGLFKKNCAIGFAEYLQEVRLEKAKELLTKTNEPIKCIAFEVGYTDPKHFARVFKSVTGIKPIEYRQLYE